MSTAGPQQLDAWTSGIREMLRLAQAALEYATAALLRQDPSLDESIAACSRALHAPNHALEDHAATVVAARGRLGKGQLPTVIAAVHINSEAEALAARYYERGVAHAVSVIEHCALLPDHAAPR